MRKNKIKKQEVDLGFICVFKSSNPVLKDCALRTKLKYRNKMVVNGLREGEGVNLSLKSCHT